MPEQNLPAPYQVQRPSHAQTVPVRTLNYHVHVWGDQPPTPDAPLLVLTHGWMDVGASYQFVVDAFSSGFAAARTIIAPDWRGFGHSMPPTPCDSYYYTDYLADLDALLDHFSPAQPVDLVGHSMGGNIVSWYAGARPQRVRRLVNLEGFGMPQTSPAQAPTRLAQWMDDLQAQRAGNHGLRGYDSLQAVAERLIKTNPRLATDKALWLAAQWAREDQTGQWQLLADSAHKIVNPVLYRAEEALACMRATTAPVLAVEADDNHLERWFKGAYTLEQYHERLKSLPDYRIAKVENAGHMLHHDQPAAVARLIEDFCTH